VAAIASTRIASGGGVSHKPQTNDAGTANGTDASSPFQQMLSTAATVPARNSSDQNGQTDRARPDSGKTDGGKKSGKDSKADGKAGQTQLAANQIIAAADSKTLIQAGAANDDGQDDSGEIDSGSGTGKDTNAAAGQTNDPSTRQVASDASQSLAAQLPVSAQDAQDANNTLGNGAENGSDAAAALLASDLNKSATPTQTVSADDAASASASASAADTSSDTSKSGKAKRDAQDAATAQIQAKDASAQINSTTQSSAPAAKKDHKSAKTGDLGNSTAPTVQATPPDSVVAMAASVPPLPTASATANDTDTDTDASDAIAAAATGQAKSGQTKPNSNSNPPAGAKPAALNDQVAADASNSPSASGAPSSPAGASTAALDGSPAQGSDASQSAGNKSAASAGDKGDNQTSAAPAQPQIQAAQPQPQPQAGVLPAVQPQQTHTGATDSVTQNIQVAQSDSSANTVSALAVAIAARSQSGNKQFDIRLDPPELGRVEVRLSIDATGKAQASLSADQPRTLDLLKTDAPALTRALRDAGLNVSQNGLNFSLRGQDRQNGGNGFTPRSGRSAQTSLIATSTIGSVQGGANYQGSADGRLDIRV
jgi:flagellar hook-length control protein FliK